MSNYTHETVPTQFVGADGVRYAYRRFGGAGTVPLLFLGYFNSNMDAWDPAVTKDRDPPVSRNSAVAQLAAIREWGNIPATGRYATLKNITHPTLIVPGNKDVVVPPLNALILAEQLPNAQLIVYADSSHGAQYQHARTFLQQLNLFLIDTHAQRST